jgi:hypothetical protein
MKLEGIINLYKSMRQQNIDRYRFEYKHGKALFDVFFFIDETPFILLFGAKGDTLTFTVEVNRGFIIQTNLEKNIYKKLCKFLGLTHKGERPFSPKIFFGEFNKKLPKEADINSKPKPHHIAKYCKVSEEKDKIYFVGWRDNNLRGEKVTPSNLEKTKTLLGHKAYLIQNQT